MLKFERVTHGDVVILKIEGQLDALSAPQMKPTLDGMLENGEIAIVMNLGDLELVDSSGIGLIVSLFKRARAKDGDLCVVGLRGQPFEVFQLLKLENTIRHEMSVDDALKYFER